MPSLNLLPNEIIVDVATVERLQSQQPQVSKRGRKRKAVGGGSESDAGRFISTGNNVEEDSDVDLYEAEFDLNDQKYIRKGASFFTIVELLKMLLSVKVLIKYVTFIAPIINPAGV